VLFERCVNIFGNERRDWGDVLFVERYCILPWLCRFVVSPGFVVSIRKRQHVDSLTNESPSDWLGIQANYALTCPAIDDQQNPSFGSRVNCLLHDFFKLPTVSVEHSSNRAIGVKLFEVDRGWYFSLPVQTVDRSKHHFEFVKRVDLFQKRGQKWIWNWCELNPAWESVLHRAAPDLGIEVLAAYDGAL
jgi:hypothetical protein